MVNRKDFRPSNRSSSISEKQREQIHKQAVNKTFKTEKQAYVYILSHYPKGSSVQIIKHVQKNKKTGKMKTKFYSII